MLVSDAKPNDIIEIIIENQPTGRFYKISKVLTGKEVRAIEILNRRHVRLFPFQKCKLIKGK